MGMHGGGRRSRRLVRPSFHWPRGRFRATGGADLVDSAPTYDIEIEPDLEPLPVPVIDQFMRCTHCGRPNAFTCPRCGNTTYDPNNVAAGFCPAPCMDWTGLGVPVEFNGRSVLSNRVPDLLP